MIKQFRSKTDQELAELIRGWKSELLALRFQQAVGQLSKPHKFKELRISVARALTVLTERKAAVAKGDHSLAQPVKVGRLVAKPKKAGKAKTKDKAPKRDKKEKTAQPASKGGEG